MSRHAYHFAANVKFIFTHILRFSPRILLLHAWTVPSGILVSAGSSFFAGALVETIRKNCGVPEDFPVFNVQAGMNHAKLKGGYAFGIKMLTKIMSKKKNRSSEEEAMLELLVKGGDYVSEENLSEVLEWYNKL